VAEGKARERAFSVVHGVLDGRQRSFAFLIEPIPRPGDPRGAILGFELRLDALRGFLEKPLTRFPLLPESLAKRKEPVGNAALAVTVLDPQGAVVLKSREPFPGGVTVDAPFADTYEGVLAGYTARVTLDTAAAPLLVSGGLPRSRLPFLALMLLVSAGVTAAALLQLRRERAFLRLREEFVASVSHELRTPLTQIRMFAETLLLARTRSEAEEERALVVIDREARRLTHLVENVLVSSRASRGVLTVSPEDRSVAPLLREVVESFSTVAEARRVRLRLALDEAAAARIDADAVRHVVLNLLDNAVKYGPAGGEVRIGLERADGLVRITVEDEGPGIPASDRQRVFSRFERLARERDSAAAGAGIGLAVVRDLVDRMAGSCSIEAGAGGRGARFVVAVPAAAPEKPATPEAAT
jgi:signal transduction histidine kinase